MDGNKGHWSHADYRRHGWHNLYRLARYSLSFRAKRVMRLEKRFDLRIAELESVRVLAELPSFSAMVIIRGQHILFERYAADFGPRDPHSIQSITKTLMNLVIGRLVADGKLVLSRTVADYVPEIGTGYAKATLQEVLDMNVVNDYTEDFADSQATYYRHEEAMGWRLPSEERPEETEHAFLRQITSSDTTNRSGQAQYKDANSAVLAWVAERASGHPLRVMLADIVDAAGIEDAFWITTDRVGVPTVEGGACLSGRDLARYFSLFVRRGIGVSDEQVGDGDFIDQTLKGGVQMPPPYSGIRYSNHLMVSERTLGHGGWGGQYVMANLNTGNVGVFLSVLENEHATNEGDYATNIIQMLDAATSLAPTTRG